MSIHRRSTGSPTALAVLAAFALTACGARSDLVTQAPPALDAALRSDAFVVDTALDATPPDVARDVSPIDVIRAPCTWSVEAPSMVTRLPNDQLAGGSVAVPGGVLVAYTNNNDPSPDPRYYIQRVDELGVPTDDRHALFDHMGSYGGMSLATRDSRYGAMAWDEARGCRFSRIDANGVASGTPRVLSPTLCRGLRGTPLGFVESEDLGNALGLRAIDAAGTTTHVASDITSGQTPRTYAVEVFDDGSIGAAWLAASGILYQRFDANLSAVTMPARLAPRPATTTMTVRLASIGSRVVIAWQNATDASDSARAVSTAEITRDGSVVRPPSTIPGASPLPGRNELVLRAAHDDVLAGYIEGADTTEWHFELQVLDAGGLARAEPLVVRGTQFVLDLGIVETSRGALVTYVTGGSGATQVAATPLTCTR